MEDDANNLCGLDGGADANFRGCQSVPLSLTRPLLTAGSFTPQATQHLCPALLSLRGLVPVIKLHFLPGDVIFLFLIPRDSRKGTGLRAVWASEAGRQGRINHFLSPLLTSPSSRPAPPRHERLNCKEYEQVCCFGAGRRSSLQTGRRGTGEENCGVCK